MPMTSAAVVQARGVGKECASASSSTREKRVSMVHGLLERVCAPSTPTAFPAEGKLDCNTGCTH
eukprot:4325438-Amphidinium_carterae.1